MAAPEEAGEVARLLVAFRNWMGYSHPGDPSVRASVERLIADPAAEYLLGAPGEGAAAGVVQMRYRHSVWTATDDAWLEDLYVEHELRGSGLGRALTEFAVERARERGCARIQLDTAASNETARGLYESLGFRSGPAPFSADALYMTLILQDVRNTAHS